MAFETWTTNKLLSFFMVLMRISTMIMLLPIFGDKSVPGTVKIILSLTFSAVLYPILKANGVVHVQDVPEWSSSTGKLLMTLVTEILTGLAVGFASQLVFH